MTARVVLVRHGRATAGWGDDPDPGLDETGQAQAEAVAEALAPMGPLPILVSPLRRTRETAAALERRWRTAATVEPAVGEVPSPTDDLSERAAWLRRAMAGTWADLDRAHRSWRDRVVERLLAVEADTVVVTHFVAMNVAVGAATGDDRVVCFRPDNCARTVLEVHERRLRVVDRGSQASTRVL